MDTSDVPLPPLSPVQAASKAAAAHHVPVQGSAGTLAWESGIYLLSLVLACWGSLGKASPPIFCLPQTSLQICLTAKAIRRMKLLARGSQFLCPWLWLREPKKTALYDAGRVNVLRLNCFFRVTQPTTGAGELHQHLYRNTAGLKITGDHWAAGRGAAALGRMPDVSSSQNDPSLPASLLRGSALTEAALMRLSTCCSL